MVSEREKEKNRTCVKYVFICNRLDFNGGQNRFTYVQNAQGLNVYRTKAAATSLPQICLDHFICIKWYNLKKESRRGVSLQVSGDTNK